MAGPGALEAGLLEVIPFDPETLLPESIRPWISDMAEQMQAPIDYLGTTAMVATRLGARAPDRDQAHAFWRVVRGPQPLGNGRGAAGLDEVAGDERGLEAVRRLEERAQERGQFFARTMSARPRTTNGARRRRKR